MSDADRALGSLAQRRTPHGGVPTTPWHEEHTGVHTDAQVFRALKSLHSDIQANKAEAAKAHGALSQKVATLSAELGGIKKTVGDFDQKLDRVAESSAKAAGALEVIAPIVARSKTPSGDPRAVAEDTLAKQVLAGAREDKRFGHKFWLVIVGGAIAFLTSGAFLHWAFAPRPHPPSSETRSVP